MCLDLKSLNKLYFYFLLVICLFYKCLSIPACDQSRQIFEGVSFGEITDGINANYTQVKKKIQNNL